MNGSQDGVTAGCPRGERGADKHPRKDGSFYGTESHLMLIIPPSQSDASKVMILNIMEITIKSISDFIEDNKIR